jgi:hypothetical protein
MKRYKIFVYLSVCIVFCCLSRVFAKEQNAQIRSGDTSIQKPKVIATFESINKWKATVFLQPLIQKIKRTDGTEVEQVHTLCYVGVLPKDSNTIHPVWQCVFGNVPGLGNLLPDKFVLGPAEGNKLCLAFMYRIPTGSFCLFVLDPNNEVNLYKEIDDASKDKKSPNAHLDNQDPNNVIPLSNILKQYKNSDVGLGIQTINSVCYYANSAVFYLSGLERNFVLHYAIIDGKPIYSVYKLNDLTK